MSTATTQKLLFVDTYLYKRTRDDYLERWKELAPLCNNRKLKKCLIENGKYLHVKMKGVDTIYLVQVQDYTSSLCMSRSGSGDELDMTVDDGAEPSVIKATKENGIATGGSLTSYGNTTAVRESRGASTRGRPGRIKRRKIAPKSHHFATGSHTRATKANLSPLQGDYKNGGVASASQRWIDMYGEKYYNMFVKQNCYHMKMLIRKDQLCLSYPFVAKHKVASMTPDELLESNYQLVVPENLLFIWALEATENNKFISKKISEMPNLTERVSFILDSTQHMLVLPLPLYNRYMSSYMAAKNKRINMIHKCVPTDENGSVAKRPFLEQVPPNCPTKGKSKVATKSNSSSEYQLSSNIANVNQLIRNLQHVAETVPISHTKTHKVFLRNGKTVVAFCRNTFSLNSLLNPRSISNVPFATLSNNSSSCGDDSSSPYLRRRVKTKSEKYEINSEEHSTGESSSQQLAGINRRDARETRLRTSSRGQNHKHNTRMSTKRSSENSGAYRRNQFPSRSTSGCGKIGRSETPLHKSMSNLSMMKMCMKPHVDELNDHTPYSVVTRNLARNQERMAENERDDYSESGHDYSMPMSPSHIPQTAVAMNVNTQFVDLSPIANKILQRWTCEADFNEEYSHFIGKTGCPITKLPVIGFVPINLYKMFKSVIRQGGYNKVTRDHKWKVVFFALNPKSEITNATTCTRRHYEKLLYPFENYIRSMYEEEVIPDDTTGESLAPTISESTGIVNSYLLSTETSKIEDEGPSSVAVVNGPSEIQTLETVGENSEVAAKPRVSPTTMTPASVESISSTTNSFSIDSILSGDSSNVTAGSRLVGKSSSKSTFSQPQKRPVPNPHYYPVNENHCCGLMHHRRNPVFVGRPNDRYHNHSYRYYGNGVQPLEGYGEYLVPLYPPPYGAEAVIPPPPLPNSVPQGTPQGAPHGGGPAPPHSLRQQPPFPARSGSNIHPGKSMEGSIDSWRRRNDFKASTSRHHLHPHKQPIPNHIYHANRHPQKKNETTPPLHSVRMPPRTQTLPYGVYSNVDPTYFVPPSSRLDRYRSQPPVGRFQYPQHVITHSLNAASDGPSEPSALPLPPNSAKNRDQKQKKSLDSKTDEMLHKTTEDCFSQKRAWDANGGTK